MKKFNLIFVAAACVLLTASIAFSAVLNSVHDFSSLTADGQVCQACHTPHNGTAALAEGLLWNHDLTTTGAAFVMYGETGLPNFLDSAPVTEPNGISLLCLSCHDGTVAVEAFGGSTGTSGPITGPADLGTDLSDDHPISIIYDAALVAADGGLNPITSPFGTGSIEDVLDVNNELQCSTCHDVHDEEAAGTFLLRLPVANSQICSGCHTK